MIDTLALTKIFRPRSVAIVGASPQPASARNRLLRVLMKHGFRGAIYPVNPTHAEIEGLKTYLSVDDLPEVPDLALVITPAMTVPKIVAQCGKFGIRAAIVYSSGFEEVESGKQYAVALAAAAQQHNVTLLGANCQGVWSVGEKAMLTFGSAPFALDTLKYAPIAVVSQSGALGGAIGSYMQSSGLGCSYIVSVGNETCIDLLDVTSWLIEQDDVRVLAMYLEGLHDAGRILAIAERARERKIQLVALKAGRSAVGQQATASHTGKIASAHAVYADVFEQAGIITLESPAELLVAMEVIGYLPDPRTSGDPKGGVSILSISGGASALLADHAEDFGVPMAQFGPDTAERLARILPDFARQANPVDLTGQIRGTANLWRDSCAAVGADPRTEALVIQFASSAKRDLREEGEVYRSAARQGGYPMVISCVAETIDSQTRQEFRDAGIFISTDTAMTMQALAWLYRRQRVLGRERAPRRSPLPTRAPPSTWSETMDYLEASGIRPANWLVLGPNDRAATACTGLAYPLVVKVLPSESEHKTELGLVKLRVRTPAEVDAHAADFRRRLGKPGMGVLVQEMVDGGVEVVLSCLRNTDFGPIVSIGTGGIAIELFRDVAHLALPVSAAQVLRALQKLKLWTLLQGFRGQPPADVEALAGATAQFGDLFLATPALSEFEINPLLVKRRGEGLVAVDALVAAHDEATSAAAAVQ
jgi:acyl-CoA synthetase (NDP forming)